VEHFPDSYALADDPQAILQRLVRELSEFAHLSEARLACIFSEPTLMLHGQPCFAYVCNPHVQGPNSKLVTWQFAELCRRIFGGEEPDFLIYYDAPIWRGLTDIERERLVYHELCHVVAKVDENGVERRSPEDGRVILRTIRHDYEFFDAEVRRYGPTICSLDEAAKSIAAGYRATEKASAA
jgi:hypothetical protein